MTGRSQIDDKDTLIPEKLPVPEPVIEVEPIHADLDQVKIKQKGKRTITKFRDKTASAGEGLITRAEARRRGITLSTQPHKVDKPADK